ncbi:MAG: hypothetical protein OQK04_06890, partial [Kangiellaceae bacterium]|nr:hypothetical protein [Kangiellaceae bacterium]
MKVWFVVYCKPQKDDVAEGSLLRQGFEVYRPLINRAITKSKRAGIITRSMKESLFPRYIFLNVDPEIKSLTSVKYS